MMIHSWALRGVAGSLLLLAAAAQTRADQVSWGYQWSSNPQLITSPSSRSFLVMPFSGPSPISSGAQNVTAAVLGISSASSGSPDTIPNTPYSLTLTLLDKTSGQQVPVTFQGQISGSLWSGGAFLSNVLSSPSTQSVTVGSNVYQVTFESFGAPQAVGNNTQTLFTFQVAPPQGVPDQVGPPQQAPEPSTLTLGLFCVPGLLVWAPRRLRSVLLF